MKTLDIDINVMHSDSSIDHLIKYLNKLMPSDQLEVSLEKSGIMKRKLIVSVDEKIFDENEILGLGALIGAKLTSMFNDQLNGKPIS